MNTQRLVDYRTYNSNSTSKMTDTYFHLSMDMLAHNSRIVDDVHNQITKSEKLLARLLQDLRMSSKRQIITFVVFLSSAEVDEGAYYGRAVAAYSKWWLQTLYGTGQATGVTTRTI